MKWETHVDFNNDMWWAMPHELSDSILEPLFNGAQQVSFFWGWEGYMSTFSRRGSFRPKGTDIAINRYIIDLNTMDPRDKDNDRTWRVKVVCVLR